MDRTIWKNRENVNQHTGDSSSIFTIAKPMNGHAWIHGPKSGRMVHVGAVDAPVTLADVNGHPRRNAAPIVPWETAMSCNASSLKAIES